MNLRAAALAGIALALLVAACGGTAGVEPEETSDVPDVFVTLYRSPT